MRLEQRHLVVTTLRLRALEQTLDLQAALCASASFARLSDRVAFALTLRDVLEGFAQVMGPALEGHALHAAHNVCVVDAAPHTQVLREATAVVAHCGHGTVLKALAR